MNRNFMGGYNDQGTVNRYQRRIDSLEKELRDSIDRAKKIINSID